MRMRELFSRHQIRCTKQRLALYKALVNTKSHPTAEELYRMVSDEAGGLSRATVYNTLEALCTAGLARRMPAANGCCRFDADLTDHLHVRIGDTAEIQDVPPDLGEQLLAGLSKSVLREIEQRMGIRVDGVSLQLLASKTTAC
jgi:Fe2+ or Zn2+ uptake regulation protein